MIKIKKKPKNIRNLDNIVNQYMKKIISLINNKT